MTSNIDDQSEKDREAFRIRRIHDLFLKTLDGRLLNAPVAQQPGVRVLDVGSGSGIWAVEFARRYPTSEVVGIDLFVPEIDAPPGNCSFLVQDAEKDWKLQQTFDIIHTRIVPWHAQELGAVLRRCHDHLSPGGYIELQEVWPPFQTDEGLDSPDHASILLKWGQLRLEGAAKIGIDQSFPARLPALLSEAGFVDVEIHDDKWPVGPWMADRKMQEIGDMWLELIQVGAKDFSVFLLAQLSMEESDINELVERVRKELGVGRIYQAVRFAWARKPE